MKFQNKYYLIIVCLLFYHVNSFSQTITIGTDVTCQFDTVTLPITINTSTNVGAVTFSIDFDTSALTFVDFTDIDGSLSNNGVSTFNQVGTQTRFIWFSFGLNAAVISDTIVKVRFIGQQATTTNITWDVTSSTKSEIADIQGNSINATFVNGSASFQAAPIGTLTTPTTTICDNQSVVFTATNGSTYEFYVNGQVAQTQSPSATYTTDTLNDGDVVSVQIFNAIGCSHSSTTIVMGVNALPISSLSGDTSTCEGEISLLTFSLPATGLYDVSYKTGASTFQIPNMINGAQIAVLPTSTSNYILTTVTNPITGCSVAVNDTVTITIFPKPVLDLGGDTSICSDETLLLDAGNAAITYLWSDNSSNQTLTVDTTGSYSVIVTDANNCQNADTINVLVDCFTLTGQFVYANSISSPMSNTSILLVDQVGDPVILPANSSGNPVVTDVFGNYSFTKVPAGKYFFQPTITMAHGGVTIEDGTLVLKVFTLTSPFDQLQYQAAEVNADNVVNSVDAMMIGQRAVGNISFFPAGDWTYDTQGVTISSDLFYLFRALCKGDVNKSYVP